MSSSTIDQELEAQIEPWLRHMRWRADFEEWRLKRIWQENYQSDALEDVRRWSSASDAHTRTLDLGAGMGGFAVAYALHRKPVSGLIQGEGQDRENCAIVAMDYNLAYCEITRTRARRYDLYLPTLVAAGEALPFANESFGVLTCWDVVEHVQQPETLFSEIARVLKPAGSAFVTVINRLALVDPHYHLRFVNWLPRNIGERYIAWRQRTKDSPLRDRQKLGEMHYFTFGGAARLAASVGLRVQDLDFPRSRFTRLPRPLGPALYRIWRTFGMGTYRLVLTKPE